MKRKVTNIVLIGMILAGLSLLLYPTLSNYWNKIHQSRSITTYVEQVSALEKEDYETLWEEVESYNRSLAEQPGSVVLSESQMAEYQSRLHISDSGIMGYVEIPDIDCILPFYHGTSEGVLQEAVGHLEWTSLPAEGDSVHCVLSGHRGLPSARLFTDLDSVVEGDVFYLHVLDRTLAYEVDQIRIVEPRDVNELLIEEGENYCTLLTCTPYGINSHRLLVRGHQITYEEEKTAAHVVADAVVVSPMIVAPIVAVPLLILLFILWWIQKKIFRYKEK